MTWNPGHYEDWNDWTAVLMLYGYGIFLGFWRATIVGQCQRAGRALTWKEHLRL